MNTEQSFDPTEAITLESNIIAENKSAYLNKLGFIRAPTEHAQWVGLLNEAWNESRIPKMSNAKEYLVLMLERQQSWSDISTVMVGLEYYQSQLEQLRIDSRNIQQLADATLMILGLFEDQCKYRYRMATPEHIMRIGRSLYHDLWLRESDAVYKTLSDSFFAITIVLKHMSKQQDAHPAEKRILNYTAMCDVYKEALIFKHMYLSG